MPTLPWSEIAVSNWYVSPARPSGDAAYGLLRPIAPPTENQTAEITFELNTVTGRAWPIDVEDKATPLVFQLELRPPPHLWGPGRECDEQQQHRAGMLHPSNVRNVVASGPAGMGARVLRGTGAIIGDCVAVLQHIASEMITPWCHACSWERRNTIRNISLKPRDPPCHFRHGTAIFIQ